MQMHSTTRPCSIDVAVTSPLQPKYIKEAAKVTGYAAEKYAEEHKVSMYAAGFGKQGVIATPVVFETFGKVCYEGERVLKEIAASVAVYQNITVSKAIQMMNEQLSCSLMQSNALAVLERNVLCDSNDKVYVSDCVVYNAVGDSFDESAEEEG